MKIYRTCAHVLVFACALAFAACDEIEDSSGSLFLVLLAGGGHTAGEIATYTADGVSFSMAYVPRGITFPTGVDDESTAKVKNAYWIGESEVTYQLWQKVHTWATAGSGATGAGQYHFASSGTMGDGSGDSNQHPVTTVNWRDCMVWCNALTEWFNAQNGTTYKCVYMSDAAYTTPIRDSRDGIYGASINPAAGEFDNPYMNPRARGFRLLTTNEYELAARYRDGSLWTYGDHASGDESGACYDDGSILGGLGLSTVFGDYAIFGGNSGSSTAAVKSLGVDSANALGLYDMSGNVTEWCFTFGSSDTRPVRGGNWIGDDYELRIGDSGASNPYAESVYTGFRVARTD